jgi:hypothetical protein
MPVHHRPKDTDSTDPRGHSSLKGGVDTVLLIESGSPRRISVTKQKDAEFASDMAFNLRSVDLGNDEDGDAVTSCVIEMTDAAPRQSRGVKLADGPKLALSALERAIREAGQFPPADLPDEFTRPGVSFKVATVKDWQALAIIATADPDKSADTIARTFRRNREKLQALKIVHVHGDYAWPA